MADASVKEARVWVFTPLGFFSATRTNPSYVELPVRQQTDHIMVRARVRADLERLFDLYCEMGLTQEEGPAILAIAGHDYPYRMVLRPENWTALVARMADNIDYSNFKSAVEKQASSAVEGAARHDLYLKVWGVMHGAEQWLRARVAALQALSEGCARQRQCPLVFADPRSDDDMEAFEPTRRGWHEWLQGEDEPFVEAEIIRPRRRKS